MILTSFSRWQRKPFQKVRSLHGINWARNRPWWRQPRQWASASSDRPHQIKRVETHHRQTQKEKLTGQPREKLGMFIWSVLCQNVVSFRMPVEITSFPFPTSKSVEPNRSRVLRIPKTRRKTKHDKLCLRNFGRCSWWFPSQPHEIQHFQPTLGGRHDTQVTDSPGNSHRPALSPNQPWSVRFASGILWN